LLEQVLKFRHFLRVTWHSSFKGSAALFKNQIEQLEFAGRHVVNLFMEFVSEVHGLTFSQVSASSIGITVALLVRVRCGQDFLEHDLVKSFKLLERHGMGVIGDRENLLFGCLERVHPLELGFS
jgi:hypothetical protein